MMNNGEEEEEGEWEEWEDEDDETDVAAKSLFDETSLPSVTAAFQHDVEKYEFDLRQFRLQEQLDEYDTIRVINFIRSKVAEGLAPPEVIKLLQGNDKPYADDKWLQPVLPDDALLFYAVDGEPTAEGSGNEEAETPSRASGAKAERDEVQRLRDENEALREALEKLCFETIPPELARERAEAILREERQERLAAAANGARAGGATSSSGHGVMNGWSGPRGQPMRGARNYPRAHPIMSANEARADRDYFDSYGFFEIHRDMLSDKVRTDAYQRAIEGNPGLFKGQTVLDVGCGTGILSMFAARAGASTVVGVEGSWRMAQVARDVTAANGLAAQQGGPIHVVHMRMEEVSSLPVAPVDVIVSEWMGYALLFEAMLDSVLHARDRWLKPGGAILPDKASLQLTAVGEDSTGLGFWDDVYGFRMDPIRRAVHESQLRSAAVVEAMPSDILSDSFCIREFDLMTMGKADTQFTTEFKLVLKPKGKSGLDKCHALALWFDVTFSERFCTEQPVVLSTSPAEPQTHWKQTLLVLRVPILLAEAGGTGGAVTLAGRISLARGPTPRSVDVSLECAGYGADGAKVAPADPVLYSIAMGG